MTRRNTCGTDAVDMHGITTPLKIGNSVFIACRDRSNSVWVLFIKLKNSITKFKRVSIFCHCWLQESLDSTNGLIGKTVKSKSQQNETSNTSKVYSKMCYNVLKCIIMYYIILFILKIAICSVNVHVVCFERHLRNTGC